MSDTPTDPPTARRIKYVIEPGTVTSQRDGQEHYIGPQKLMFLYGVNPKECEIYEPAPWWPKSFYEMAAERHKGLVWLAPRYDGNYSLPK